MKGWGILKIKKMLAFFAALFGLMLSVVFVAVYISYHNPVITEYVYRSDKLTDSFKIVAISDLHSIQYGDNNSQLIEKIKSQYPDTIFMVGDFVNKYDESHSHVTHLVKELSSVAPVYFSLGNHEGKYMANHGRQIVDDVISAGATFLDLDYRDVEIAGQNIRIGGMVDYAFALDNTNSTNPQTMKKEVYNFLCEFQNSEKLKIMLAHRPDSFVLGQASKTWDVDLVISGHTHGGQVRLPFVGGLYASDQGLMPDYVYGLYKKDKVDIIISSGLGSGFTWVPRFNNPPEIVLINFIPEN